MQPLLLIEYIIAYVGLFVAVLVTLVYLRNISRVHQKTVLSSWYPEVSVIIPAYNEEKFIAGCLKSVLALDYPASKLEVIVVDDGSKDNTAKAASDAAMGHANVRVLSKPNSGKAGSLNFAIKQAKGEIVACLDADSYVQPYSLRRMLSQFTTDNVAAVASAVKVRAARNIVEEVQRIEYLYALFSRKIISMLNSVTVTPGPFSMFRRKVLLEVGGFDTKSLVEDQEIALRLQKNGYAISSSTDSDVYTEIPNSFMELMQQRTRWQRGGFWNSVKYVSLISPKYGDLGIIVVPFSIFGYIMLVSGLSLITYNMLTRAPYEDLLGWDSLLLSIGPIHIFGLMWIALALLWFFFGVRRMFRNDRFSIFSIAAFLLLYPIFTTIFWFTAAYTEIKASGKRTW